MIICMVINGCFTDETNPSYCISRVTVRDEGCYYCQVKNQYGEVKSTNATVTVETEQSARHHSLDSSSRYFPMPMSNRALTMPHIQYTTPSKS